MMVDTYWGTDLRATTTNGPDINAKNLEETATKTLANLQPIYARLNRTADWAQQTENIIINFIGSHEFPDKFKSSSVTYGRYYILETPGTLMDEYLSMRKNGANQTVLNEALKKYYHSAYKDNHIKLAIMVKLMLIEPFIHQTLSEIQDTTKESQPVNPAKLDYLSKLYYSDWLIIQKEEYLLTTPVEVIKKSLQDYAIKRQEAISNEVTNETITISEKIGVGGTQSLQAILSDFNMSDDQKKWSLVYLFGLTEEMANKLTSSPKKPNLSPINNTTFLQSQPEEKILP